MNLLLIQNSPYLPAFHGASICNRFMLEELAQRGHRCAVLAPAHLNEPGLARPDFLRLLEKEGLAVERSGKGVDVFTRRGVTVHAVDDLARLRAALPGVVAEGRPDWVFVCTEDPGQVILHMALEEFGGRVIYLAHTPIMVPADATSPFGNRTKAHLLKDVAAVLTVSEFVKRYVDRLIDVRSWALPLNQFGRPPFPNHASFDEGYVTIVNPSAQKGITIFAEMARRLPHVAFAAVTSWGTSDEDRGLLASLPNVRVMAPTEDIEEFYSVTRVLLVPSIWQEARGRVTTEAMLRGIPVLASNVGGIPEAKLGVDHLLPVRPITRYVERFDEGGRWRVVPELPPQDVDPWVETLRALLSDRAAYDRLSARSREAAERYVRENGIEVVERFLLDLTPAPSRPGARPASEPAAAPAEALRSLTSRQRAALMLLLSRRERPADRPAIPRQARQEGENEFPLSFAQQRLWFLERLQPGEPTYNMPGGLRLRGPLEPGLCASALNAIVARHEILRTRLVEVNGEPRQRIAPGAQVPFPQVDLSGLLPDTAEREVHAIAESEATRTFDLMHGPLLRVMLVRLAPEDHVLLFTLHHIVNDGWSTGVLLHEFSALYPSLAAGAATPLDPLPVQYADYAVWQRRSLEGGALERQLDYWRQKLAGPLPRLEFHWTRPPGVGRQASAGIARLSFTPELTAELRRLSRGHDATLFMTLLAAFKALLHRYTGDTDVLVGTDVAGRSVAELKPLIGFFVNQLVLRTDLGGDPSFAELLARVREVTLAAYAQQDVPFDRVVSAVNPERSTDRAPLIRYKLLLTAIPEAERSPIGLQASRLEQVATRSRFDLTLAFAEEERALRGVMEYRADLFAEADMERFGARYEALLRAVVADPGRRLSELAAAAADRSAARGRTKRRQLSRADLDALSREIASRTP